MAEIRSAQVQRIYDTKRQSAHESLRSIERGLNGAEGRSPRLPGERRGLRWHGATHLMAEWGPGGCGARGERGVSPRASARGGGGGPGARSSTGARLRGPCRARFSEAEGGVQVANARNDTRSDEQHPSVTATGHCRSARVGRNARAHDHVLFVFRRRFAVFERFARYFIFYSDCFGV